MHYIGTYALDWCGRDGLKMGTELRCSEPIIHTVHIDYRYLGQHFLTHAGQTAYIDTIHPAYRGIRSDAKTAYATVLAEVMFILFCIEQIPRQFWLPGQQTEIFRFRYRWPEPGAAADGTVTAVRRLGQIDVCLECDGTTMTTALPGFLHISSVYPGSGWPLPVLKRVDVCVPCPE
jgi:hypothetical protein